MRPCRLCKAQFKPTTHVVSCADAQEFCKPAHRTEYWKYGALPFDKLLARMEKRVREICTEIVAEDSTAILRSLETLATRLRNVEEKTGMHFNAPRLEGATRLGIAPQREQEILNQFLPAALRR